MRDHIINIHPSELLSIKTKESIINELKKKSALQYQKLRINNFFFKYGHFTFST